MRHGVIRGIEVVKPAPVLIRDKVRRERVQQLEIMIHRNRHARPVRVSRPILQRRKDEFLAEPFQQPADDVAVRAQVARREDFFFEDVVGREEAHLFNVDGNGCSVFGGKNMFSAALMQGCSCRHYEFGYCPFLNAQRTSS